MKTVRKRLAALAAAAVLPLSLLVAVPASAAADPQPTQDVEWENFAKITLTDEVGEPMSMAVLPDSRVLHTNRQGNIRLFDPETATTQVITSLPVYDFSEDGMQGIALSPDFEEDNWLYVYYSPEIAGFPEGAAPDGSPDMTPEDFDEWMGKNRLSRFKFVDRQGSEPARLDMASEQKIMKVEMDRGACCHVAGDIDFDKHNNLWLVTGDDTPATALGANNYPPYNDYKTNETQTVRVLNATGGTFTLTFDGQTTEPIAFNANAAAIRTRDRVRDFLKKR